MPAPAPSLLRSIAAQQRSIASMTSEAEELEHRAESLPTQLDRDLVNETAQRIRKKIQTALIDLHAMQDRLPSDQEDYEPAVFALSDAAIPRESSHLWTPLTTLV